MVRNLLVGDSEAMNACAWKQPASPWFRRSSSSSLYADHLRMGGHALAYDMPDHRLWAIMADTF